MTTESKGLENLNTEGIIKDAALALKAGSNDTMQLWSDEKRKDFCKVFEARSRASAYILTRTAEVLLDTAYRRQFVGQKALGKLQTEFSSQLGHYAYRGESDKYNEVGGRDSSELDKIAHERARDIFQNLPPLKQAVQLIKPEVAKKLDTLDALKTKVKKYGDQLDTPEYAASFKLSQVDQKMTVGAFRQMVRDRVKARNALVQKFNEAAKEAMELEDEIAKDLYAGIPELQDAITDVARRHFERAAGMGQMNRRVEEQVKFGDSKAATAIVKQFEADEQAISPSIKAEFDSALEKLKLSAPQVKKLYAAQKKEKK
jgi:hypothetical protein